jgi:ATP-dependent 26S proteasome regulatory subunit
VLYCVVLLVLNVGMFAIRDLKKVVTQEHFMNAVRKIAESKRLEQKLDYAKV